MEEIHISFLELQSWSLEFVDSKIEDIRVYCIWDLGVRFGLIFSIAQRIKSVRVIVGVILLFFNKIKSTPLIFRIYSIILTVKSKKSFLQLIPP
jgi:hypothetical protein